MKHEDMDNYRKKSYEDEHSEEGDGEGGGGGEEDEEGDVQEDEEGGEDGDEEEGEEGDEEENGEGDEEEDDEGDDEGSKEPKENAKDKKSGEEDNADKPEPRHGEDQVSNTTEHGPMEIEEAKPSNKNSSTPKGPPGTPHQQDGNPMDGKKGLGADGQVPETPEEQDKPKSKEDANEAGDSNGPPGVYYPGEDDEGEEKDRNEGSSSGSKGENNLFKSYMKS